MKFTPQSIPGAFVVEGVGHSDERGTFSRAFCGQLFEAQGLDPRVAQTSVSRTHRRGTIRGMHWQAAPFEEAKLVRCLAGEVWDVMLDLRPTSPLFGCWQAVLLQAHGERAVYIPAGVAHGFQTQTPDVILYYQMSVPFAPEASRGVRFDDPDLAIAWPLPEPLVSPKDRALPLWRELQRTPEYSVGAA
jgi:dTDP-4-dehydrorhamnose 3,5-epimerase